MRASTSLVQLGFLCWATSKAAPSKCTTACSTRFSNAIPWQSKYCSALKTQLVGSSPINSGNSILDSWWNPAASPLETNLMKARFEGSYLDCEVYFDASCWNKPSAAPHAASLPSPTSLSAFGHPLLLVVTPTHRSFSRRHLNALPAADGWSMPVSSWFLR